MVHARHNVLAWPCEHLYSVHLCKHHLKSSCGCVVAASAIREESMPAVLLQIKNVCSCYGSLHLFPASSYPFPSSCTCLLWVQRSVGHIPHIHVWCPIIHTIQDQERTHFHQLHLVTFQFLFSYHGSKENKTQPCHKQFSVNGAGTMPTHIRTTQGGQECMLSEKGIKVFLRTEQEEKVVLIQEMGEKRVTEEFLIKKVDWSRHWVQVCGWDLTGRMGGKGLSRKQCTMNHGKEAGK